MPTEPGVVEGTVTDSNDNPVEGADVAILDSDNWSIDATTTTDSNGNYRVEGLEGGTERYHALTQYDDGSNVFNAESLPFLDVDFLGKLVHIETQVASGDSSIDFTNVFTSDYDRYVIVGDNIIPSDDGVSLQTRLSSDGGSTWDSGSSDYAYSQFLVAEDGSTNTSGSGSDSFIDDIFFNAGNDTSNNDTSGGKITVSNPTNSNRATVVRSGGANHFQDSAVSYRTTLSGGIRLAQSAIDSIQFLMETGNISSGIFSVYGVDQ